MTSPARSSWHVLIFCGSFLFSFATSTRAADKVQFNRDIRPILSDRCFKCHGPDKAARKAGLRLDLAQEATAERKEHTHAIVPRKPGESLVIRKIFSSDEDDMMPPKDSNLSLTAEEKQKIRRWISEGAEYQPHWAFISVPDSVPVPAVKNKRWPRNEIDHFILARLEKEGLKPSAEADKTRWLRRVTYDLNGLPPTPAEVDDFLHDQSKDAYEKVVDRLLASKHFGERMAVPWLDAARYADSYGYQSDLLCPTWPFRDWVIKAFNENMPYDEFLTEQLAGDLLPNATRQQRLATAFNRLHRQTNEGGSIEDEWRNEYVSDRVHTFSTTFLAVTFECARCHDHKFDPILQRDYYSLGAFFNSIDEWGTYNDSAHVPTPALLLPTPEQEKVVESTSRDLQMEEEALSQAIKDAEPVFQEWLKHADPATNIPGLIAYFSFDAMKGDHQIVNEVRTNELSGAIHGNTLVDGKSGKALQFTGDDEFTLPENLGQLQPWDQYTIAFWARIPRSLTNGIIFHTEKGTDTGFFGTELSLDEGRLFFAVKHFWPGNAIAVRSVKTIPADEWAQIAVSFDGSGKAGGIKVFLNGEAMPCEVVRDNLFKSPQNSGGISFGARFRSAGLKGGTLDELRIYNRPLAEIEIKQLFDGRALKEAIAQKNESALRDCYAATFAEKVANARVERARSVKAWLNARDAVQERA